MSFSKIIYAFTLITVSTSYGCKVNEITPVSSSGSLSSLPYTFPSGPVSSVPLPSKTNIPVPRFSTLAPFQSSPPLVSTTTSVPKPSPISNPKTTQLPAIPSASPLPAIIPTPNVPGVHPTPTPTPIPSSNPLIPPIPPSNPLIPPIPSGGACGYQNQGTLLNVTSSVQICVPSQQCTPEVCPPSLASCLNGVCVFKPGYSGLATIPTATTTNYCTLGNGSCNGGWGDVPAETASAKVAQVLGLPLCKDASSSQDCVGIAAVPGMMHGLQNQGVSDKSNLCYKLKKASGGTIIVAVTDWCGGYCTCSASPYADGNRDCPAACSSAADLNPITSCIGSIPGLSTSIAAGYCDWCASDSHPHFDLDTAAQNHLCGGVGNNCTPETVTPVSCKFGS